MAVMRPPLRLLRAGLAPLLLTALLTAFVGGCSSDADGAEDGDDTVTATVPEESDTPSDPTTAPPAAVAEVCAPYVAMVDAIEAAAGTSSDPDEVAAEIGPVLKEFAAVVPSLQRPRGIPPETWRGVVALATEIGKLPEAPTDAELEAVEGRLSDAEQEAVEDAFSWFQTNCT
jgi:hypothetical protein